MSTEKLLGKPDEIPEMLHATESRLSSIWSADLNLFVLAQTIIITAYFLG